MMKLFKKLTSIKGNSLCLGSKRSIRIRISLFFFILPVVFITNLCAQTENNWPAAGYTAYRVPDNEADTVVIRDAQDKLAGKMVLTGVGADYHDPLAIAESTVYAHDDLLRWGYNDASKNGLLDGVYEDFESFEIGDRPRDILESKWFAAGNGLQDSSIQQSDDNKYLHLEFNSPPDDDPFILGYLHKDYLPFNPKISIKNSKIKFDIRTNHTESVDQIITPRIVANFLNRTFIGTWELPLSKYETFPHGGQGWQTRMFNANDLTFGSAIPPDYNRVLEIDLLFRQNSVSQINGSGFVDIDNFQIGEVSEDDGGIIPEYSIEFDAVLAGEIPQNTFLSGQKVSVVLRAQKDGLQEYCSLRLVVFDSSFSWPSNIGNSVYDSAVNGENYTTILGKGESESHTFTFWLPANAPTGQYTILGILESADGLQAVRDTTGPDRSFDDRTIRAYIPAFTVNAYPAGTGPVAVVEADTEPVPIDPSGNVSFTVDASRSFHVDAPVKQIVSFEWDTDNDGIFEITDSDSVLINRTLAGFDPLDPQPIAVPVSLQVTDNSIPAQSATISRAVLCVAQGNLEAQFVGVNLGYLSPGKVIVYDENYENLGSEFIRITDASGNAVWQNLPVGNYIVEAYNYDPTPFSGKELWVSRSVTVNTNQTTAEIIQRDMPYIENVELRYYDNDVFITSTTEVPPGTSVSFNVTVRNESLEPQTVRIQAFADRDQFAEYDLQPPLSGSVLIPPAQSRVLEVAVNPLHPAQETIDTYYYALLVQTLVNGVYRKTDVYSWTQGFMTRPLTVSRKLVDQFTFSGLAWKKTDWMWQSGLHNDNVILENDTLSFRVKNNVGVGGQAVTIKNDFHYGTYRARVNLTKKQSQFPEGVVFGFFYYWNDPNDADVFQEIDFEFRTHDRNNAENLPQITVSVHNTKAGEDFQVFSFQIPLQTVEDDMVFEWRWLKESVSFYVNGQLAMDNDGNAAIVDETNFPGRIPDKPSTMFFNQWSGKAGNTFAGTPPQGLGDFISSVKSFSYTPAVAIKDVDVDAANNPVLQIKAYSNLTIDIFGCDNIGDELWQSIGSVSGSDEHQFTDTVGNGKGQRYYQLRYRESAP